MIIHACRIRQGKNLKTPLQISKREVWICLFQRHGGSIHHTVSFSPKDHIIVSDDLYGGTYRLFEEIYKKYGLEFSYVNTSRIQDIEEAVKENTKAFL